MDKARKIEVLKMISEDAKNDARYYEGRPFSGREVAEYFGKMGAMVATLARLIGHIVIDNDLH